MIKYFLIILFFKHNIFLLFAEKSFLTLFDDTLKRNETKKITAKPKEFTFLTVPSLGNIDLSNFFGQSPMFYPWGFVPQPQSQQPITERPKPPLAVDPTTGASSSSHSAYYSDIGYDVPCGVKKTGGSLKIVGGTEAAIGEFPWQVSLQLKHRGTYSHLCGGAVLSPYWIVTAGHCVHNMPVNELSIVSGDYDLYRVEGSEQRSHIVRVYQDDYNYDTFRNDIALLYISPPIKLNEYTVAPICLPRSSVTFDPGSYGTVSGWGRLSENGELAHRLQKVDVPIIEKSKCDIWYKEVGYDKLLNKCQLCAGMKSGGKDSCQGDSGGPMVCQLADGRYYLCGVVSWGIGCARPGFPGVYTKVTCYSDWIKRIIYNQNYIK